MSERIGMMCHCGTFNLTVYNRRDNSYLDTSGFIHTKATCPDIPLTALAAAHDKYRDACERLIGHYGNPQTWGTTNPEYNEPDLYLKRDGMAFARQVEAELKTTQ